MLGWAHARVATRSLRYCYGAYPMQGGFVYEYVEKDNMEGELGGTWRYHAENANQNRRRHGNLLCGRAVHHRAFDVWTKVIEHFPVPRGQVVAAVRLLGVPYEARSLCHLDVIGLWLRTLDVASRTRFCTAIRMFAA